MGAVQVKIMVKSRGQHIAYRVYTGAQTTCVNCPFKFVTVLDECISKNVFPFLLISAHD